MSRYLREREEWGMDVGDEWAGARMAGSGRMEERKGAEKGRDPLPRDHALSAAMPKAMAARPRQGACPMGFEMAGG